MDPFDYVVVGAGSAGCVLAARLSKEPQRRVLLPEAGAADGPETMAVPPAWPMLIGSGADWGYTTLRDPNIVDGMRQSAADGHLRPVLGRANLTALTGALVHRLSVAGGRCGPPFPAPALTPPCRPSPNGPPHWSPDESGTHLTVTAVYHRGRAVPVSCPRPPVEAAHGRGPAPLRSLAPQPAPEHPAFTPGPTAAAASGTGPPAGMFEGTGARADGPSRESRSLFAPRCYEGSMEVSSGDIGARRVR